MDKLINTLEPHFASLALFISKTKELSSPIQATSEGKKKKKKNRHCLSWPRKDHSTEHEELVGLEGLIRHYYHPLMEPAHFCIEEKETPRGRERILGLILTICLCVLVPTKTRTMAPFISNPDEFVFSYAVRSRKEHQRPQSPV